MLHLAVEFAVLVNNIKPQLISFLEERGLTLSEEKTHVTHINDGFDFLGFNLRKYKGKLLIKPSKSNVLSFLGNLRELIKKHATIPVNDLIKILNPKLRGWAIRRHPTKNKDWVCRKYYLNRRGEWQFHGWQKLANMDCHFNLVQIAKTPIKRHVKIMSKATPYDPFYKPFLKERKVKKQGRNSWFEPTLAAL